MENSAEFVPRLVPKLPEGDELIKSPSISKETMERICTLELTNEELTRAEQLITQSRSGGTLIYLLATRNLDNELPGDGSFIYQRNLEEVKELKKSAAVLYDKIVSKKELDRKTDGATLSNIIRFLAYELRKADWLEKEYYPQIFRLAKEEAKGDVTRFLITERNTGELDNFRLPEQVAISFKDQLNYVTQSNAEESVGTYRPGQVVLKVPEYFNQNHEWNIYQVLVHELVHNASYHGFGRVGVELEHSDPNLKELNEAITEIVTYYIVSKHLESGDNRLGGEPHQVDLGSLGYKQYTLIVRQIFSKIPSSFFVDAMLNEAGLTRLAQKFDEVTGESDSLIKYGRNLRDLYNNNLSTKSIAQTLKFSDDKEE